LDGDPSSDIVGSNPAAPTDIPRTNRPPRRPRRATPWLGTIEVRYVLASLDQIYLFTRTHPKTVLAICGLLIVFVALLNADPSPRATPHPAQPGGGSCDFCWID
jgi:hypothetical protein